MQRLAALVALVLVPSASAAAEPALRAGAAAVDVTPERFPVVVNCGFLEAVGKAANDRLFARALVLDDGTTRLGVVLVDSCMMPREFLDKAKALIAGEAKVPADRLLIAATHTHTAPAVMGCLGSDADPAYAAFLERQLVQVVRQAVAALRPAKAGWAVVDAGSLTNNRQWILRSDKMRADPFGQPTVKANMHPGYVHPDFVGPSGPIDPWLSVVSVRTTDDVPLAALVNFSMHYFGAAPVSADYFGRVCLNLEKNLAAKRPESGFVAIMSQGTAGDLHWMDYGRPQAARTIDDYAAAVTAKAEAALAQVKYRADISLAMAETTLTLGRRTPDAERLAWARKLLEKLDGKKPTNQAEVYAREAVLLRDEPRRELKLQALRIGDLGIAALPNEVFALTGLKIRATSPLVPTFTVELANGADGYIPPREQHPLGGYTTWPARSAGLEVGAEAKITEAVVSLLEKVADRKRRPLPDPKADPYAAEVLKGKPVGYWRLGDLAGPDVADLAGRNRGRCEPGVVFGLDGPLPRPFDGLALANRAAHFAGGRVKVALPELKEACTVEGWFWNGFPADVRDWTGTLFAFAKGDEAGDRLALAGRADAANALAVAAGFRTWHHAAFVREGGRGRVYLDGKQVIDREVPRGAKPDTLWLGGRPDGTFGLEGRLAEVALFDRALAAEEVAGRMKKGGP